MRHDVHDVAVTLDCHLLRHTNTADLRNPAQIVPCEIDQHHVFSALFRIGEQIARVCFVGEAVGAAWTGPRNRPKFGGTTAHPDVQLRRTTERAKLIAEVQQKHVGRGISKA